MLTHIKRSSLMTVILALSWHGLMLFGWRWQQPFVPYFFDATVLSGQRGLDFYSIYQAGYNARQGWDIYENDPNKVSIVVPYFTPYRYLPLVAYTVGAGLSLMTPLMAYKAWVVMIELTLLTCVYLTWRGLRDPNRLAPLVLFWLGFTPFYLELFMGQFSLVQGALIFMLLRLTLREAGPGRAAFDAVFVASVLWKINTIILAPALLLARRFRPLILTALAVLVTTVPYFIIFPAHARDFWANNFGNTVAGHELGNLGFRQLVFELFAVWGATPAFQRLAQWLVVGGIFLISTLFTFYLSAKRGAGLTFSLTALWLTAFFLVSPQIWEHHYVMLLPILVMVYSQKPHWAIFVIWLGLALPTPFGFIGLQPVIAANHDLRAFALEPAWQPLLQHASKALPTLMLWGYFLRDALRQAA